METNPGPFHAHCSMCMPLKSLDDRTQLCLLKFYGLNYIIANPLCLRLKFKIKSVRWAVQWIGFHEIVCMVSGSQNTGINTCKRITVRQSHQFQSQETKPQGRMVRQSQQLQSQETKPQGRIVRQSHHFQSQETKHRTE